VGHRQYDNPSKACVKSLRQRCRLSWQRAAESLAPQSFDDWLRYFEKFIEWMRQQAAAHLDAIEQTNDEERLAHED
jgi:hypothetical protein